MKRTKGEEVVRHESRNHAHLEEDPGGRHGSEEEDHL